jgi:hypothetical protein
VIEGLWIVRFLEPQSSEYNLNGGVVVIETERVLGGDSGYFYVGDVGKGDGNSWPISVVITRHDPNITSVFGDMNQFALSGRLSKASFTAGGFPILHADLTLTGSELSMVAELTKVSELP